MADDFDERSLDPTPHRRQQMRAAGHVARSQELTSAAVLLGGLALLLLMGPKLAEELVDLLRGQLSGAKWNAWLGSDGPTGAELASQQWNDLVAGLGRVMLPALLLVLVPAVGISLWQTGLLVLPGRVAGDWSRVNPLSGLARLFSWSTAGRMGFSLLKLGLFVAIGLASLYPRREELCALAVLELPQLAAEMWSLCLSLCIKLSLAASALAIIDYAYQRWKFERQLRMTPQEMREEQRHLQGDAQLTGRRRAMHRQMLTEAQAIGQADVVVASPEGVAVALRYDAATMSAPQVVAKLQGAGSKHWRKLAAQRRIPWVEKTELAQSLHAQAQLHRPVDSARFVEVAEVLALAYQARGKSLAA